jgi:Na+/H+ antiporter NhaD/arsenite permease-like protein
MSRIQDSSLIVLVLVVGVLVLLAQVIQSPTTDAKFYIAGVLLSILVYIAKKPRGE